ncbi:MAG: hypothetical protein WAK15_10075, partial [Candidatus Cybelea sp.]
MSYIMEPVNGPPWLQIFLPPHESHFLASGLAKTDQVPFGFSVAYSPVRWANAATCFYTTDQFKAGKAEVAQMPQGDVTRPPHSGLRLVGPFSYSEQLFDIFVPDYLRPKKSEGFELICASAVTPSHLTFTNSVLSFTSFPASLFGIKAHDYGFVVDSDGIWNASNVRPTGDYTTSSRPGYQLFAAGSMLLTWTDPDRQAQRDYLLVFLGLVAGIAASFLVEAFRPW